MSTNHTCTQFSWPICSIASATMSAMYSPSFDSPLVSTALTNSVRLRLQARMFSSGLQASQQANANYTSRGRRAAISTSHPVPTARPRRRQRAAHLLRASDQPSLQTVYPYLP